MIENIRIYSKYLIFFTMVFILTGFLVGQPDIDTRQGEKEIEIMKSVISTSLAMTKKDLRSEEERDSRYRRYGLDIDVDVIEGYYLHGQGVVFTIPYPCLTGALEGELEELEINLDAISDMEMDDFDQLVDETAFLEMQIEMRMHEFEMQRHELDLRNISPPRPPAPPLAPDAPEIAGESESVEAAASSERQTEIKKDIEKRVARIQVNLREVREKSEEQEKNAAVEREAIKQELINVIAVHGDSLTQVKENEYINLVLKDRCGRFDWGNTSEPQTVLSVKRSDLTAYRSGQLSLDQLKSRFVEY